MIYAVAAMTTLLSLLAPVSNPPIGAQAKLRIAIVGLAGKPEIALAQALARDSRVVMIEGAQLQPALAGFGYDSSVNMTTEQARRLGAAIGCDFFVAGKYEVAERSERERQSHHEAIAAVMIVDSRTGALAVFDLIIEKAATGETALAAATKTLDSRAPGYVDRMLEFRAARSALPTQRDSGQERVEEMPEENSPQAVGFKPPEPLNRVKPEYTEQAERCDVAATVEAMAVFRADGQVGEVTITRWAGFGLDEAAERAIRQLKFKPATRDGQPVSVRALIRYNFRRVAPKAVPAQEPPKPEPERDLRQLFKPRIRIPTNEGKRKNEKGNNLSLLLPFTFCLVHRRGKPGVRPVVFRPVCSGIPATLPYRAGAR